DATSPYASPANYTWTAGATGNPAAQTVTATNGAGLTSSATVTISPDSTVPTANQPTVTAGYYTSLSVPVSGLGGSDGGSGANAASFTATATSMADGESGLQKVNFPAVSGGSGMTGGGDVSGSPYQSTYTWTATTTASGAQTVNAYDNAGLTSGATFTVTPD